MKHDYQSLFVHKDCLIVDIHRRRDAAAVSEEVRWNMKPILVVGGSGKTGRRVVERLSARGLPVRIGSRAVGTALRLGESRNVGPGARGVDAAYVTYYPDLAAPGAADAIRAFATLAVSERSPPTGPALGTR